LYPQIYKCFLDKPDNRNSAEIDYLDGDGDIDIGELGKIAAAYAEG